MERERKLFVCRRLGWCNSQTLPPILLCVFAGRKLPGHSRLLLADWTEQDVQIWLSEEGLEELVSIFKANNIDGAELNQLSKETVAELGVGKDEDTIWNSHVDYISVHTLSQAQFLLGFTP